MKNQTAEVWQIMSDRGWRTLRELATKHGDIPEASASARLRELRRYGCKVERRIAHLPNLPPGARVYEYRVLGRP